jgi:6,7-dimethyl-8-ribityllumazine synthase
MSDVAAGTRQAADLRVAIVVSRFNEVVTEGLLRGARECLEGLGCDGERLTVLHVPGAWEIPQAVSRVLARGGVDGVITLGALIRGETPHFEVLAGSVAAALAELSVNAEVPLIFGILTTDDVQQALDRAGPQAGNKGWEAALSAVEMIELYRSLE